MNHSAHPPVDVLADHREGLISGVEAGAITAHLKTCADCRGLVASLDDVADLLAAEGAQPLPMPADVAASLDEALTRASRERSSGVPNLADRRTPHDGPAESTRPHRRVTWPLLGAAAVAVLATAVGIQYVPDNSSSEDSQAGGGDSQNGSLDSGDDAAPGAAPEDAITTVTRTSLAEQARQLATYSQDPDSVQGEAPKRLEGQCATPTKRYGSGPVSLILWEGDRAVLVLDPEDRTATVVDCETATKRLFTKKY